MTDVTQEDRDRAAVHHGYGSWGDVSYWASGKDRDEVEKTAALVAELRIDLTVRPDAGDDKGVRGKVDWTMPLEAVHSDGRVVVATAGFMGTDGLRRSEQVLDGVNRLFHEDGSPWSASGWRIRNTPRPNAGNEEVAQVLRDAGDLLVMPDYSQLAHREMVKRLRDCLVRITGNKE